MGYGLPWGPLRAVPMLSPSVHKPLVAKSTADSLDRKHMK